MGEADALERGPDAGEGLAASRRRDDAQVLERREVPVEARLVHDRSDAGERLGAALRHRRARAAASSLVRLRQAEQHPDQRRLARAVRPEVAERDPARDLEIDAADHLRAPNRFVSPLVSTTYSVSLIH